MRFVERTQDAVQIADEYHDEFVAGLDELQNMDGGVSMTVYENCQQFCDRMQVLSEFWDIMAERLKAMADLARQEN